MRGFKGRPSTGTSVLVDWRGRVVEVMFCPASEGNQVDNGFKSSEGDSG